MDTFGSWPHVPLLSCEAAKSLPKKYRKSKRSGVKGLESSPGGEGMQPVGGHTENQGMRTTCVQQAASHTEEETQCCMGCHLNVFKISFPHFSVEVEVIIK